MASWSPISSPAPELGAGREPPAPELETGSPSRAWRLAAAVAGAVIVLDQATKQLVVHSVERGSKTNVFFGIDLTYVRNKGVAFGAFGGGGTLVTVFTLAAVALLAIYFAFRTTTPYLWLPFGAVAGGAIGNLADRIRDGAVVDFIDPILWPAFNVADVAIVVGILGLLYVIEGPRLSGRARRAG